MVYLAKGKDGPRVFYSEGAMKAAGFTKADKAVTEEEFNSNGCYARVVNGEIAVGLTAGEKQERDVVEKIAEIDGQLSALDSEYLTPRILGGAATGDQYSKEQISKHESAAAPLREERDALDKELKARRGKV